MTIKQDLQAACDATRVAFKSALDDPDFNDNTLSELWRHFLGLQRIAKDYVEPTPEVSDSTQYWGGLAGDNGAGGYDTISFSGAVAAGPVDWNLYGDGSYIAGGAGADVITFNT